MRTTNTGMELTSNSLIGGFFQHVNPGVGYNRQMQWNKRLIELRKQAQLSRVDLARKAGLSYDSLNKIERGDVQNPRGDAIPKLAAALGVSPAFLRYGAEDTSDQNQPMPSPDGSHGRPELDHIDPEIMDAAWAEALSAEAELLQGGKGSIKDLTRLVARYYHELLARKQ